MSRPYRYPVPVSSEFTPEGVYLNRRRLLEAAAMLPLVGLAACGNEGRAEDGSATPASGDEELTTYSDATHYNNFYEFGTGKGDPSRFASTLRPSP